MRHPAQQAAREARPQCRALGRPQEELPEQGRVSQLVVLLADRWAALLAQVMQAVIGIKLQTETVAQAVAPHSAQGAQGDVALQGRQVRPGAAAAEGGLNQALLQ